MNCRLIRRFGYVIYGVNYNCEISIQKCTFFVIYLDLLILYIWFKNDYCVSLIRFLQYFFSNISKIRHVQLFKRWYYQKFIAFNIKKTKIIEISSVIAQFLSWTICHKILICILAFKIFWNADIYNIFATEL